MDLNKIVGAMLVALLVAVGLGKLGNTMFSTHGHEEAATAYSVAALTEDTSGAAEAAVKDAGPQPITPLLAAASSEDGARLFRRCAACHGSDKGGPNKIGPNLWGIVGRQPGTHDGFAYSNTLATMTASWDFEALNRFLANPKAFAPGTKMNFTGIPKPEDRANLITFLRGQADQPVPLPSQ